MSSRKVRDIEYQLLPGTDRKTTDIVIERDGKVVVRPPADYAPEQVDEVVESKRLWIYRNLAEWKDLNACAVVRKVSARYRGANDKGATGHPGRARSRRSARGFPR